MPLTACMVTLRAGFSKSFLRSLRLRIYGAVDKISPVRLISPPPPAYPPLASPRQNDIIGGEKPPLEGRAMEYLTVRETARKWDLSDRMVQQFCIAGRIPGAQKFGNSWAIPADAEKPGPPFCPKAGEAPCLQSFGQCRSDAPDEHPLPAGHVHGRGTGHGGWPPAGHRYGGVLLLHRPAGESGTGGGGLPHRPPIWAHSCPRV